MNKITSLIIICVFILLLSERLTADEILLSDSDANGSVVSITPMHQQRFSIPFSDKTSLPAIIEKLNHTQERAIDKEHISMFSNRFPIQNEIDLNGSLSYWNTIKAISLRYNIRLLRYRKGLVFDSRNDRGLDISTFVDLGPYLIGASTQKVIINKNSTNTLRLWPLGIVGESDILFKDTVKIRKVIVTNNNGKRVKVAGDFNSSINHNEYIHYGWEGRVPECVTELDNCIVKGYLRGVVAQRIWRVKAKPGAKLRIGKYGTITVSPEWEPIRKSDKNIIVFNPNKPDNYLLRVELKMNPTYAISQQLPSQFKRYSTLLNAVLLPDDKWCELCQLVDGKIQLELEEKSITLQNNQLSQVNVMTDRTIKDYYKEVLFLHSFTDKELEHIDDTGIEFTINGYVPYDQPFSPEAVWNER